MATPARPRPSGRARPVPEDGLLVSKTDPAGRITYANRLFRDVSGYSEEELLGAPHSLIRHPDMPRAVFAHLWDELAAGREVFAPVVNLARDGDHYWVLAHVTPSHDARGRVVGFHSTRRCPPERAVEAAVELYAEVRAAERAAAPGPAALAAGRAALGRRLAAAGQTYEGWVFAQVGAAAAPG